MRRISCATLTKFGGGAVCSFMANQCLKLAEFAQRVLNYVVYLQWFSQVLASHGVTTGRKNHHKWFMYVRVIASQSVEFFDTQCSCWCFSFAIIQYVCFFLKFNNISCKAQMLQWMNMHLVSTAHLAVLPAKVVIFLGNLWICKLVTQTIAYILYYVPWGTKKFQSILKCYIFVFSAAEKK